MNSPFSGVRWPMDKLSSSGPVIVETVAAIREHVAAARRSGRLIGLVPTMGALHAGHLSLVSAARKDCGFIVATIFVNPLQFGPSEDFSRYPRPRDRDLDLLAAAGVNRVYLPTVEEMYPPGFATQVSVPALSAILEGAARPTHFAGVSTVVLKLFQMVQADLAYFGQKDFQQARLLQQMVRDLNLPVSLRVCPIIRDKDGLALSSRNQYLSTEERKQALVLSRIIFQAEALFKEGERDAEQLLAELKQTAASEPGFALDYLVCADPHTLQPVPRLDAPTVVLIAGKVGQTRLIDNTLLTPPVEKKT